jgi:geranylgeranyl pyrophosphate synthase
LSVIKYSTPVKDLLPLVEECMHAQSNGHHPDLQAALTHLLSSGGKRVRPIVTLLSAGMLGAETEKAVILAAAVELLHTATLVHDDLIDGALLRRGIPTLNASWSPAATILTGDFIFARAARLAAETESVEIMCMFAQTLSTVVNGEINQIFKSKGLASREDYYNRIHAKTASMFELASAAPVYLTSLEEEALEAMKTYGYQIGMAFQIVDDILDFTSNADEIGKPVASDLRQGLVTLPALYYLEENPENPDFKEAMYNGSNISDEVVERVVVGIRESGAVEKALEEAEQYSRRGIDALAKMPPGPEFDALNELANYVVRRDL